MCFVLSFLHLKKKKKRRVSWTEDTAVLIPSVPATKEQSGLGFYFYKHRLCRQELAAAKQPQTPFTVSMLRENAGPKVSEDTLLSHVSVKQLLFVSVPNLSQSKQLQAFQV